MSMSEELSRLNTVIGIPSICARTHAQRKNFIQAPNVHGETDPVLSFNWCMRYDSLTRPKMQWHSPLRVAPYSESIESRPPLAPTLGTA